MLGSGDVIGVFSRVDDFLKLPGRVWQRCSTSVIVGIWGLCFCQDDTGTVEFRVLLVAEPACEGVFVQ